jgi:cobalt-zinc-cadmium resistance protein CzcA
MFKTLLIATPKGTQIPLNAVAKVEIVEGPNQIQRENAQRRIIVGFNVRGRDVQSMVKELTAKSRATNKIAAGLITLLMEVLLKTWKQPKKG